MGNTNAILFPAKDVQPTPCVFQQNKIIFCTDYKLSKESSSGIFEYDSANNSHKRIQLWHSLGYYPFGNTMIYNSSQNMLISAGGTNVKDNDNDYKFMMVYNTKTAQSRRIDIDHSFGYYPGLIFTNNDNHLHIIGGYHYHFAKHVLFDFTTNKSIKIHSFHDAYSRIYSQGLLYRRSMNAIIMFGGCDYPSYKFYDDFWMCDVNNKYKWKQYHQYKMPITLCGFGAVLYDDRIIIVFGGESTRHTFSNAIYYIDLNGVNGWEQSVVKMPKKGSCNAVIMNNNIIHIIPYHQYQDYYTFTASAILPSLRHQMVILYWLRCYDILQNSDQQWLYNVILSYSIRQPNGMRLKP